MMRGAVIVGEHIYRLHDGFEFKCATNHDTADCLTAMSGSVDRGPSQGDPNMVMLQWAAKQLGGEVLAGPAPRSEPDVLYRSPPRARSRGVSLAASLLVRQTV
jgi:hypothetical protein